MSESSASESHQLLKSLEFCVFDLETTGGNQDKDKIIEIGMVKIKDLEITEKKGMLIRPEIKIPDFIQKLTNISQKDVKESPVIEDVIDEILNFMGDSILVAHNTSFDVPFFNSVLRRLGKPELKNNTLCTNLMTKYMIPNLMNSNLNYMSRIFKIGHNKAHRALDDAEATAELLLKYLRIFEHKNISKVNNLYYPRNRFELDRANFKKGDDIELVEKKLLEVKCSALVTFKGENGIILYSLPYNGSKTDRNKILEKSKEVDWENITIKLYGPLLESIVHLNTLYSKLEANQRQDIFDHLCQEHLPELDFKTGSKLESPVDEQVDFIILHHLVPEQMIIYPIQSLHPRSELIFRYPGHKKKLVQYINSKGAKIKTQKLKKVHFHPQLKQFLDHYLVKIKDSNNDVFMFSRKLVKKGPQHFHEAVEEFLDKNPNPYNFPRDFI